MLNLTYKNRDYSKLNFSFLFLFNTINLLLLIRPMLARSGDRRTDTLEDLQTEELNFRFHF